MDVWYFIWKLTSSSFCRYVFGMYHTHNLNDISSDMALKQFFLSSKIIGHNWTTITRMCFICKAYGNMPNTFYIMPTTPGRNFGVLGLNLGELMEFLWCVVTGGTNLSKMSPNGQIVPNAFTLLLWHWKHYWSILVTIKPFSMIQNIIFSHIHIEILAISWKYDKN